LLFTIPIFFGLSQLLKNVFHSRFGYNTAVWCQRYELFCDEKERRRKATELVTLMEAAVKIHYKCMHLFNLPKVICDPLRRQFDYNRCTKVNIN
uniref:G_PROTEIN_RECEP_F1_2 domain-containing protein n=1 Tax=Angiostrongylus costaricensis TaxID=334426 RepID=A0A0R3PWE0_ANGCS